MKLSLDNGFSSRHLEFPTFNVLLDRGWITVTDLPASLWSGNQYQITDDGRAAVAAGL